MTLLISFAFVVILISFLLYKIISANKEAKRLDRLRQEMRQQKEQEVLDRLEKIRKRDDTARAKDAIDRDPERAAKVVKTMMKK